MTSKTYTASYIILPQLVEASVAHGGERVWRCSCSWRKRCVCSYSNFFFCPLIWRAAPFTEPVKGRVGISVFFPLPRVFPRVLSSDQCYSPQTTLPLHYPTIISIFMQMTWFCIPVQIFIHTTTLNLQLLFNLLQKHLQDFKLVLNWSKTKMNVSKF